MQIVRVYDATRQPPNWRELIQPGQLVAFSKQVTSGAPCDEHGRPFVPPDAATCLIVDTLAEADAFCRAQVEQHPEVQFDLFAGAAGRSQPPLLTIVHPSRAARLEGNPRSVRFGLAAGAALVLAGPLSIWYEWAKYEGLLIWPTVVGINLIIAGLRLIQLNASHLVAEKTRRTRLAAHARHEASLP